MLIPRSTTHCVRTCGVVFMVAPCVKPMSETIFPIVLSLDWVRVLRLHIWHHLLLWCTLCTASASTASTSTTRLYTTKAINWLIWSWWISRRCLVGHIWRRWWLIVLYWCWIVHRSLWWQYIRWYSLRLLDEVNRIHLLLHYSDMLLQRFVLSCDRRHVLV